MMPTCINFSCSAALTAPLPYTSSKGRNAASTKHADLPRAVLFDMTNDALPEDSNPEPAAGADLDTAAQTPCIEETQSADSASAKAAAEDAEQGDFDTSLNTLPLEETKLVSQFEEPHVGHPVKDQERIARLPEDSMLEGAGGSTPGITLSPPAGSHLERTCSSVSKIANWGSPTTDNGAAYYMEQHQSSASKGAGRETPGTAIEEQPVSFANVGQISPYEVPSVQPADQSGLSHGRCPAPSTPAPAVAVSLVPSGPGDYLFFLKNILTLF